MKIARFMSMASAVLLIFVMGFIQASNVCAADRAPAPHQQSSDTADRTPHIAIPDSKLARDAARYIRHSEGSSFSSIRRGFIVGQP